MMLNMRNLQIEKLQRIYPQMAFHKQSEHGQEWRVPLLLPVSPQPLFIKVTIGPQFPMVKPIVQIMSRVQHPSVELNTYCYKGTAISHWSQNSQLDVLVQAIHAEFAK